MVTDAIGRPASFGVRGRSQSDPDRRRRRRLGAPRARTAGPALALGWIAGLLAVSVVVVLLVGGGSDSDSDDPGLNWFKIAIGILFLLMAAKQWTKRPKGGEEPEQPG